MKPIKIIPDDSENSKQLASILTKTIKTVNTCLVNESTANENLNLISLLDYQLRIMCSFVQLVSKYITELDREKHVSLKWTYAAMVLDKLFLYVSLAYAFITFIAIILSCKSFYGFF